MPDDLYNAIDVLKRVVDEQTRQQRALQSAVQELTAALGYATDAITELTHRISKEKR